MPISNHKERVIGIVQEFLAKAGFAAKVSVIDTAEVGKNFFVVTIDSKDDMSLLIGKNGQNLSAFEHLVRIIASKTLDPGDEVNFIIDVDDYRKSRADTITRLARETVQRVLHTRRAEAMAPMTAYERRLVHMELASYSDVQTESIGQEPRRRIVIKPELIG